jgi:hypothetical protein
MPKLKILKKNPGRRRTPGAKPKRKGGIGNSALPSYIINKQE